MIWKKRGLVFDPSQYHLPQGCDSFAQSPQAVVFENHIRIYFSTRNRDDKGQYLSHIAFVDMDLSLDTVIRVSEKPVIQLGKPGTFDEHGIFPFSPFKEGDALYGFTCGWNRRVSVPVETGIGLAQSRDNGETFQRVADGPVLAASLREPFLVGDGFVQRYNGLYHMWYIFGLRWMPATDSEPVARVYKIGHATSKDLLKWEKREGEQIITDVIGDDECQALPTVVKIDERYHMYFCFRYATDFRTNPERGYRLGYAFSDDLYNWTRADEQGGLYPGGIGEWDSDMMCYPQLFQVKERTFMLYNGNEFGKFGFGLAELISD